LKAWNGQLPNLTALDADTAQAFLNYKGNLQLPHNVMKQLLEKYPFSPETALRHAQFLGGDLAFLTKLDAETAAALAELKAWNGQLPNLTALDADTAAALAKFAGPQLALGGITAFESPDSVAVAKALATRQGPLSLPNLEKISPKTLTALIEKQDVDIPLIETLELIPEPDGSATEDFVIPEGFQERRK
jgi:hypothetical protein